MRVLSSADALSAWAEDEGWLDDSVLVSARLEATGRARIRIGLRVLEDVDDPRDRFNRTSERFFELSLEGDDPVLPRSRPTGPFEVRSMAKEGRRFGLVLDVRGRPFTVLARRYRVIIHGEVRRAVRLALGPELCFHGPGPVTIEQLVHASGVPIDCYRNWKGSGQAMGSAFVTATVPEPVTSGEFEMAIRVVPAGAPATDPRGLWLVGQSLPSAAYVIVRRSKATEPDLAHAVVQGLASVSGLTWASSGNMRVETVEDRDRWLAT
jgi:hypothetical protein